MMYIAKFRHGDAPEALVVADIHDASGKIVGERCYGWHPEIEVTPNGVDVDENWARTHSPVCTRFFWSSQVKP